jgi:hypothetical protein
MSDNPEHVGSWRHFPDDDSTLNNAFWVAVRHLKFHGRSKTFAPLDYTTAHNKILEFHKWSNIQSPYSAPRCRVVYTSYGWKLHANANSHKLKKNDCIPLPAFHVFNECAPEDEHGHYVMDFVETKTSKHYTVPTIDDISRNTWALLPLTFVEYLYAHNYTLHLLPNAVYESATDDQHTLHYLRILRDIDDDFVVVAGRGIAPHGFDPSKLQVDRIPNSLQALREFMLYAWNGEQEDDDRIVEERIRHMLVLPHNTVYGDCLGPYANWDFNHQCVSQRALRRWMQTEPRPQHAYPLPHHTNHPDPYPIRDPNFYLRPDDMPTVPGSRFSTDHNGDLFVELRFTLDTVSEHNKLLRPNSIKQSLRRELLTSLPESAIKRIVIPFPSAPPLDTIEPASQSELSSSSSDAPPPVPSSSRSRRGVARPPTRNLSKSRSSSSGRSARTGNTAITPMSIARSAPPSFEPPRDLFTVNGLTYLGFSHYWDGSQMLPVPPTGTVVVNGVLHRPYFLPGPGASTTDSAVPIPVQSGWYRVAADVMPDDSA